MGEVYRAHDTKLNRDVAIKILPELFARDPDRIARFQREAQLLAALNHPNIAAIYGLEEAKPSMTSTGSGQAPSASSGQAAINFLVLELVEGPTLAERLSHVGRALSGPPGEPDPIGSGLLPTEALSIARQVADAFEAAHEKGIIHRDLKPANIKVRDDGVVKVLDFGLAKAMDSVAQGFSPAIATNSPTLTVQGTEAGVILGTAAYMSPEQAKGRTADKRSDVWSFGCVLYEMLTGKRAFEGEDVSDTLANVLKSEPDWHALPPEVSEPIRTLLKRCLVKDRHARISDIAVAKYVLADGGSAGPALRTVEGGPGPGTVAVQPTSVPRGLLIRAATAALVAAAIAGGTAWWYASRPLAVSVTRFFVYPPEKNTFATFSLTTTGVGTNVVISPDGSKLAFTARDSSGKVLLWIRPIDSLTAQPLPGTDDARYPFWSPDSRFIAYFAQQKLLKITASGGPPQTLCTIGIDVNRGGTWSRDGTIVFSSGQGRTLSRVSSAGGQPSEFTRLPNGQTGHLFPWFLPDGRHVLFYATATSDDVAGVYVGSLDAAESKRLAGADTAAVYDSQKGHVLFVRQGTLLAQPFNPKTLAFTGESFPIAERVESPVFPGFAAFSVSNNGILAYGVGAGSAAGLQMAWFDRQGKQVETVGPPGNYRGLDLAPDGKRVAAHRHDGNGGDIWVTDLSRSTTSRFTFDASQENSSPIWSPDGTRIVYGSIHNGKGGLYQKLANNVGTEERLTESNSMAVPVSWSPDGSAIVYEVDDPKTTRDFWVLPLSGDRKPSPLLRTPFAESHGQISPDGKWLAYYSNETGRVEVYVHPFPAGAGKWQISTNGGLFPRWRRDGHELFYMSQNGGGKMMSVDIRSSGSTFEASTPRELFDSPYVAVPHGASAVYPYHNYAVSADGQRFLIPHPTSSDTANLTMPIVVVENWAAGVGK